MTYLEQKDVSSLVLINAKFYDQHYGAKPSDWEEIDDKEEIKELIINFKEEING